MSESPEATRESAGEGVAGKCVRVSQSRVVHTATVTDVRNRLGRVWLKEVSGYRAVALVTRPLSHTYGIGWGGRSSAASTYHLVVLGTEPHSTHESELLEALVTLQRVTTFFTTRQHNLLHMSSILQNPLVHYGIPVMNAGIVVVVALTLLDGTMQLAALGIAAVEILVTPQILKRAG